MMKKKQKKCEVSSSEDSDSDAERNFALFTKKQETSADERREGASARFNQEEELQEGEEFEPEEVESEAEGEESEAEGEESEAEGEESDAEGEESEADGDKSEAKGEEFEAEGDSEEDTEEEEEGESDEAEEDEGNNELRTNEDVQKELSHMSFEDVLKLQNKVGTKVYNKVKHGTQTEPSTSHKKRLNKNRPMEVSAKRPVPFLRQVVSVKKTTLRDPRFDDLSGEYKADIFEKTYGFINDIKHKEKEVLKKKWKKTKNETQKEKLQFLVKRMENQERARLSREQQRNRELQFKREQRQRANQGQAPHFLKNSERKKLQLLEKYDGLKKSGKLEQFLTKKRKRNAVKDRRKLPPQAHSNTPRGLL